MYLWVWHDSHIYLGLKKESNRRFEKTNRILRIFIIFSPSKILFGDQLKTNEMGWTFSMNGGTHVYRVLVGGKLGEREHLAYLGFNGRIILKWIL